MNKKINLSKFIIFMLLFVAIYVFAIVLVYDFDYAIVFQTPSTAIKISIVYAIIASILEALDIALTSENRINALKTGYSTHKLYITKDGEKKCNYHYLLSSFSWGLCIAFLLFAVLSKESDNILLIILTTLIIGLTSGLLSANIWGRSVVGLVTRKKN